MNSKDIGQGETPQSATTKDKADNSPAYPLPFQHPHKSRVDFDSDEEYQFYCWLGEAHKIGLITGWQYHVQVFQLSGRKTIRLPDPIKSNLLRIKKKFLLHPQQYTPDFVVGISKDFMSKVGYIAEIYPPSHLLGLIIILDVKGTFIGKNNNSAITFPVIQKWLCDKQDIYVNKLVPKYFFKHTWCPKEVAFIRGGAHRSKTWLDYPLLQDWVDKQGK